MNLLHSLWVKIFGYVIHPRIPNASQNLRVAPIGTGTGIWLIDAQDSVYPSAQLEGFNISFDGVPPSKALPSNVSFRHWILKQELPEDLVGVFDIVHLRSLSFALLNEQVSAAVGRLYDMLKPGGYIQWEALLEIHNLFSIQDPRARPTWLADLTSTLSAAGFVDVEVEKIDRPPHMAFALHECGLMMYEVFGRKTRDEKLRLELRRLLPLAVEETGMGAYTTAVWWTVTAKKPPGQSFGLQT